MKRQKSIGLRILLGIAAVVCGLSVQVAGSGMRLVTGLVAIEYILGLLGFIVMGYLIYRWAIK
jgi:hypothetical protein